MGNMPTRLVVPDWFTISQGKWLETACLRPRLGIPPCRSSGGGWKTQLQNLWQNPIHQLFQHPPLLHPDRTEAPPQVRCLMTAACCASALGYPIM